MKILLCSILAGILYRMGGSNKYNTKWRDIGVPLVFLIAIRSLNPYAILSSLLLFGALTTYWHKDENSNVTKLGWTLTGLAYSLAAFPFTYNIGTYAGLLLRAIVLTYFIVWWTYNMNRPVFKWNAAIVQEFGKGFALIYTLPLLSL